MADETRSKETCPFDGKHFSSMARAACGACNPNEVGFVTPQGEPALTLPQGLPGTREPVVTAPQGNAGESPASISSKGVNLHPQQNRRVGFDCFWASGCSDSARCNAKGSCVAASQAGGATFPQQMQPDTTPLSHMEILSAVAHHAREIARLTEAVPVRCSPVETVGDDLGDQIYALLVRRGYAQHEAHAIAAGPGCTLNCVQNGYPDIDCPKHGQRAKEPGEGRHDCPTCTCGPLKLPPRPFDADTYRCPCGLTRKACLESTCHETKQQHLSAMETMATLDRNRDERFVGHDLGHPEKATERCKHGNAAAHCGRCLDSL